MRAPGRQDAIVWLRAHGHATHESLAAGLVSEGYFEGQVQAERIRLAKMWSRELLEGLVSTAHAVAIDGHAHDPPKAFPVGAYGPQGTAAVCQCSMQGHRRVRLYILTPQKRDAP